MDSFAYTNGIFSYRSSGVGAMQNVKKLGYSTDSTSKKLKVRAKWQVADAEGLQAVAYIWTTRVPGFYDHLKLTADLSEYGAAPEDFVEFELDGSDNPNMTDDKILNIRFNILNKAGRARWIISAFPILRQTWWWATGKHAKPLRRT